MSKRTPLGKAVDAWRKTSTMHKRIVINAFQNIDDDYDTDTAKAFDAAMMLLHEVARATKGTTI